MPRRFQFSLRALLGIVFAAGVLAGCWRLSRQQIVWLDARQSGAEIVVRGTMLKLLGPKQVSYGIVAAIRSEGGGLEDTSVFDRAARQWLCWYEFEAECPVDSPGDYDVALDFMRPDGEYAPVASTPVRFER